MKVILLNLGCPKNQLDGEVCLASFLENGFELAEQPEAADVVIVNTCGFIDEAKQESISTILTAAKLKQNGKCKSLIVTGCLSQLYHQELKKELHKEVDIFLGVSTYKDAFKVYSQSKKEVQDFIQAPGYIQEYCDYINVLNDKGYVTELGKLSSYVKISEGCDNHCTYCVIPKIRGSLKKRNEQEVIDEISFLVSNGVKEIILIAQDLTADTYMLKKILRNTIALPKEKKPEWLRLMYCNPEGVDKELIEIIRNEEIMCKYIDVPIQHVSDNILTQMGRQARSKKVLNCLELLSLYKDISVRSSVMVGFPGETDKDYNELKSIIEQAFFHWLGIFVYSPQKGTAAFSLTKQISKKKALERRNELDRIQFDITNSINKTFIGCEIEVLFQGNEEEGCSYGHSKFQTPVIDGVVKCKSNGITGLHHVVIEDSVGWDLYGEIKK